MRIAVGGLHTECSTYTDVLQKTDDFKVLRGNDLMISDFFCFLPKAKAEIVPLMHARSTPGARSPAPPMTNSRPSFWPNSK